MKKLSFREKGLIIFLILIILFLLLGKYLDRVGFLYNTANSFISKSTIILFSGLNKEGVASLYKNDPLFCLVSDDCTFHGKFACPTAINKFYLAEHASEYKCHSSKISTDIYCEFIGDVGCKDRNCFLGEN